MPGREAREVNSRREKPEAIEKTERMKERKRKKKAVATAVKGVKHTRAQNRGSGRAGPAILRTRGVYAPAESVHAAGGRERPRERSEKKGG